MYDDWNLCEGENVKMKVIRECRTCEFNFDGRCAGHGKTYKYKGKIIDDTKGCECWGASLDYFSDITEGAPWYIKDPYKTSKIGYDEFLKRLDDDENGIPIEINIFDAIENTYELDIVELAKALDVAVGIVSYAKARGTIAKRVIDFSAKLCIPVGFFQYFTTKDLEELKQCRNEFLILNKGKKEVL